MIRTLSLFLLLSLAACADDAVPPQAGTLTLAETLGGADTVGFARAVEPRPFRFPADHGPHPEFRTEWWYFTGNVESAAGRRFGFQLTFFRSALAPEATERASEWAANHVYMAHFAVADAEGEHFEFERFSRAAVGLAGAQADPFRVWLEDWSADGAGGGLFPLRLYAVQDGVVLDLTLGAGKPAVLQGDRGLSRKGPEPGNASYYYSYTRLPAHGRIAVGGDTLRVRGTAWMDREWSTSALSADEQGWDWFSLQFSGGRELMYYRIRRRDGSASPFSAGTWVEPDGSYRALDADDVRIEVLDRWRSATSGAVYPSRWRIVVPSENVTLEVRPVIADQEMNVSVRYWEGAVDVDGEHDGSRIGGVGYVELTGYESE